LENVKNLVNHNRGDTFNIIHKTLTEELGYYVVYKIVDAKSWVPQHRERIFIVGFKDANAFTFDNIIMPDPLTGPKMGSILHTEDGNELNWEKNRKYLNNDGSVLSKYTLSDHLWNYLQKYAIKHKEKGNGFGFSVVGVDDVARTLSARYYKDGSEILINRGMGKNPRRLTPRECARLMGYDKPRESSFVIPVSDTQAYKQFGNAVVVPAVEVIAKHMLPHIIAGQQHNLNLAEVVMNG
jgi:DNA (cytosine-5)-methyltransferase 1